MRPGELPVVRDGVSRALIVFGALSLQACPADPVGDVIGQEHASVATWTLPPGAVMPAGSAVSRDRSGLTSTWDVTTTMTWAEYKIWTGSRSGTGYRQFRSYENHLTYIRRLPGDILLVDVTVATAGPPLKLRVSFSAHPD